jgi:hypothetical protein
VLLHVLQVTSSSTAFHSYHDIALMQLQTKHTTTPTPRRCCEWILLVLKRTIEPLSAFIHQSWIRWHECAPTRAPSSPALASAPHRGLCRWPGQRGCVLPLSRCFVPSPLRVVAVVRCRSCGKFGLQNLSFLMY